MWVRSLFVAALVVSVSSLALAGQVENGPANRPAAVPQDDSAPQSADQAPTGAKVTTESEPSGPRHPRVLYITMKGCPACSRELARLRRPGGDFDGMRAKGWKIGDTPDCYLQIVEREAIPELILQFSIQSYPTVICINHNEIVRSFKSGCTTPLDSWTFGFLLKGENERPKASIPEAARVAWTGSYPLRGNHWSIDGDWNPSKDRVVSHLRSTHGSQIAATYAIESWSVEEVKSLHDDLHEREMGSVSAGSVAQTGHYYESQPTSRGPGQFGASHKMLGR